MEAEVIQSWFTPFHYVVYLGSIFVLLIGWFQWKWSRECNKNIDLLVVMHGGGGKHILVPKTGGEVSIKNPDTELVKTWPINELATIEVDYPGMGLIPKFLQKKIRMAIVSEEDWEPLLNRSPHRTKVMSPDVVAALKRIADDSLCAQTSIAINNMIGNVSTSPTRELIASPAVLGNLMQEKISQLAVTVAKDIINPINEMIKKMGKQISPTIVYIGLALIIILLAFTIMQVVPLADSLEQIMESLGIQ